MGENRYPEREIFAYGRYIPCQILNWRDGPPPKFLICNPLDTHYHEEFLAWQAMGTWARVELRDALRELEVADNIFRDNPAWQQEAERAVGEQDTLARVLDASGATAIIHGGAKGADGWADFWARMNAVPCMEYVACWYPKGIKGGLDKSAGPKRNQRMIDEGKPDLVIAFPGGKGTADMVRRAKSAGIPVQEVPAPSPSASLRGVL